MCEFDIIAIDGSEIVVVEVKTTLKVHKVDEFIEKMTKFKEWFPRYAHDTVYGAVAFIMADEASDSYAQHQDLFVIRAVGEGAVILNESGFKARKF